MRTYRVFRRGFNAANNPSRGARPEDCTVHVATVEAESKDEAVRKAEASGVTVYNGQGIWAVLEETCLEEEAEVEAAHAGKVLVKYWHGTTALERWCGTAEEIDDCLDLHSNSYPPKFYSALLEELDYDTAISSLD